MDGQTFLVELDKIGYFSYTSEINQEEARKSIKDNFDRNQCLMVAFSSEKPYHSKDGRFYNCGDCEELFEEGGVPELLEKMTSLFLALNVRMDYADDSYGETGHMIVVNDCTYIMAQGSILFWGETFLRFAEMINKELDLQAAREKIYLLSYDDSQYMILLTQEQFEFIHEYIPAENRPLTTADWEANTVNNIMRTLNGE